MHKKSKGKIQFKNIQQNPIPLGNKSPSFTCTSHPRYTISATQSVTNHL